MPLALNPLDAAELLTAFGTAGVFVVLFAETGLLIGFFLPGDSLLVTAGLLCTASGRGVHLSLPGVPVRTRGRHLIDGVRRAEELLARYDRYPLPLVALIDAVSPLPLALEALRSRRARTAAEPTVGSAK
ncbi:MULTISPECIES: hypothetical protein [Streptomyces]|uniref:hypothetical protein n=1 Tax=Streptomyces TaxID=1883 RepID=UPI000B8D7EA3|nr:hypothetical protein [Streptomyces sp. 11-1-2]ASQ99410.1 hypothetical protein CGL27_46075 [Streptomyces sp. 11-1-2]